MWQLVTSVLPRCRGARARDLLPRVARRSIRTGFFPDDEDFIDPEGPVLADHINGRWRHMDDPTLRANILERSNVGMGMLVINRASGFDLSSVNDLYRRLRNLEVNSLKRFVGLAAMEPGPFSIGLDPKELLLAAVCANKYKALPRFSRALLWNSQELAHLVADYRKPVVCHLSGVAHDGGAALACLSSFSGAFHDSELSVRACRYGMVPMGGMTYVLASLKWELGAFLALTGWPIKGAELVALGLVEHWLSPEALPFLELTAEKQLEVSEADAAHLLREHSLPLPEDGDLFQVKEEGSGFKRRYIPLIAEVFGQETLPLIREALKKAIERERFSQNEEFLQECEKALDQVDDRAAWTTLRLIQLAQAEQVKHRRWVQDAKATARSSPRSWVNPDILASVLRRELWAQQELLKHQDAPKNLHAAITDSLESRQGAPKERKPKLLKEDIEKVAEPPKDFIFAIPERSEISLSSHPRLRKFHPDYDPRTGLDHDPDWMRQEAARWHPKLFEKERERAVEDLLGDRDPSTFGLSRWVRVEPRRTM